ncbi:MAG: hypothetical protein AB1349_00190 [Elusimicrobiota bacterium]
MSKREIIIIIVSAAFLIGLASAFCFANTINPNCPNEVKQAIKNWDSGLDERDTQNQQVASSELRVEGCHSERSVSEVKNPGVNTQDSSPSAQNDRSRIPGLGLRTLFLSSLITLTFNTPVHSQILVVNLLQKLFTVAKHYLKIADCRLQIADLAVIFTVLKKFFEKLFLLLLGFVVLLPCFYLSPYHLITLSPCLYYRFHNLRL